MYVSYISGGNNDYYNPIGEVSSKPKKIGQKRN